MLLWVGRPAGRADELPVNDVGVSARPTFDLRIKYSEHR